MKHPDMATTTLTRLIAIVARLRGSDAAILELSGVMKAYFWVGRGRRALVIAKL